MESLYTKPEKVFLDKVGKRIKELRTEAKMSEEKLAFACELDRDFIWAVEKGDRNISILSLYKISRALHMSLPELLDFPK
jgi:transcriptional regulator with XRE-family HTH domain